MTSPTVVEAPLSDAARTDAARTEQARRNAGRMEQSLSVQYGVIGQLAPAHFNFSYGEVGAQYRRSLLPYLEFGGGARLGFGEQLEGGVAFESFIQFVLAPRFRTLVDDARRLGSWRPSVGLEAGVSSARARASFIDGSAGPGGIPSDERPGVAYLGFVSTPLRFRLTGVTLTLLGLTVGTPLMPTPARLLRLQLNVLELGTSW